MCENTLGSFTCTGNEGFNGVGVTCSGQFYKGLLYNNHDFFLHQTNSELVATMSAHINLQKILKTVHLYTILIKQVLLNLNVNLCT